MSSKFDINNHLVTKETKISEVIKVLQENDTKITIVISEDRKLLGSITDGDIRRGLLEGFNIDDNCELIMNNEPSHALKDDQNKYKINGQFDHMNKFKFNNNDIKAFSILGVSIGIKWERVQEKFKKLVKKFHPDMNAGNKKYEDKLKIITLAYTQLKNTYRAKIDY